MACDLLSARVKWREGQPLPRVSVALSSGQRSTWFKKLTAHVSERVGEGSVCTFCTGE